MKNERDTAGLFARIRSFFPDHELHIRSGGKLRFIRISSKLQIRVVGIAALALFGWLAFTLVMVGLQVKGASDRIALDQREEQVAESAARVDRYRDSVDAQIARVEQRQQILDALVDRYFENVEVDPAAEAETAASDESSEAIPEAAGLAALENRQLAFARALRVAVDRRTVETAAQIRRFGIDPNALANQGMGGPLIPASVRSHVDDELAELEVSLNRLAVMELSLRSIPSATPTSHVSLSSPFGLRRDPFTGGRAMHNGLDFRGAQGQGILATGDGRVVFAGRKGGYGNCIEIDHGSGVVTRYAHLSGINVRLGQRVDRGQRIGRMGSTGRSTATHLHYEVRINGRAVNPRPFLEANRNVLENESAG